MSENPCTASKCEQCNLSFVSLAIGETRTQRMYEYRSPSAMRAKQRLELELADIYRWRGREGGRGEIPLESEATKKRTNNRRELNRNL